MMRFSTLVKNPAGWMTGKQANDVVLTSRIRLARNIAGHAFPGWARKEQRRQIFTEIAETVSGMDFMQKGFMKELSELSPLEKQLLVEKHLISREQAARSQGSGVLVNRKQSIALMVNEEDHLRIQCIFSGLCLKEAYDLIRETDEALENQLQYAFDGEWGFLTACPTNLGTGMRASAMLHLPALILTEQAEQVFKAVNRMGLAVRGLFGEGTESWGDLFQISNQSTLGESEETIINRLNEIINQVARHERNARLKLQEDEPYGLMDKISKAYGNLLYGFKYDSKSAFADISMIRLGATINLFGQGAITLCDRLMMDIQPAHLQMTEGKELEMEQRDIIRAKIIRHQLQSLKPPAMFTQEQEGTSSQNNEDQNELPIE